MRELRYSSGYLARIGSHSEASEYGSSIVGGKVWERWLVYSGIKGKFCAKTLIIYKGLGTKLTLDTTVVVASPPSLAPQLDNFVIQHLLKPYLAHSFKLRVRGICSSRHSNCWCVYTKYIYYTLYYILYLLNTSNSALKKLLVYMLHMHKLSGVRS